MADMNIRNVSAEFLRAVKSHAASEGMTLRKFVIKAVNDALPPDKQLRLRPRFPRLKQPKQGRRLVK